MKGWTTVTAASGPKSPRVGYAPPESRTKPWPKEARSGAWGARSAGQHTLGFKVERAKAEWSLPEVVVGQSLIEPVAWCDASRTSSLAYASTRPLQVSARARRYGILLTTHFSGADEAR